VTWQRRAYNVLRAAVTELHITMLVAFLPRAVYREAMRSGRLVMRTPAPRSRAARSPVPPGRRRLHSVVIDLIILTICTAVVGFLAGHCLALIRLGG